MLMFGGEAGAPALGNFYYSPVRLRPVFEPQVHSDLPVGPVKRRQKKDSLDLEMDLRPSDTRHSPRKGDTNNEEDSPLAKVNRDTGDEADEEEEEKPKPTKKKKHRKSKKKDRDRGSAAFEKLCTKLRLSYVLAFLGVLILLVCGCAIYLRNRLVACCKRCCSCWPFKKRNKKSNKDMFDVEGGDSPFLSRRSKSKKKGAASKTVDTGVPDSRTSLTKSLDDNGKIGCSPCCRKKKKKKDKKRRK